MACNENVVKNMANEITRNCLAQGVTVDPELVMYIIDLLLVNPKYGKLFSTAINRNNLQFFVDECVNMLIHGGVSVNTLKMQFTLLTNYDKLQTLIEQHLDSIDKCLKPLVTEILDEDPEPDDEAEFSKLFRKISIYIILASGLGNPGVIGTLKEGMAALESVFSMDDLKVFVALPRSEKIAQLNELLEIVSGVRLFNRDCKKGGEGIPDLPFNLVDASKACLTLLSNCLISVMQRVNTLTTAIEDMLVVQEDTGNVIIDVTRNPGVTLADYKLVFELLVFSRQYEVFVRKLLGDVEGMAARAARGVERARDSLDALHAAVQYKAAVPAVAVFPLFSKLWSVWRSMQNVMYLVSTVNQLMVALAAIQDQTRIPHQVLEKMLKGKQIVTDQDRMTSRLSIEDRLSMGSLKNYVAYSDSAMKERQVQYLGFCALCLTVGALVPSHINVGLIKWRGLRYGFCSVKMAARFNKEPDRYINEVLEHARNNPHLVHLLNVAEDVQRLRHVEHLVTRRLPKTKMLDKDIQTEAHPHDKHIEKNYTWDLWEWKRRACQWANIVNCKTHSTQTHYSHLRSETHCQTVQPRDRQVQTRRDCGTAAPAPGAFLWGLRGRPGYGQLAVPLCDSNQSKRLTAKKVETCTWPCLEGEPQQPAYPSKVGIWFRDTL